MPLERDAGASETLAAQQDALAAYIRDPERVSPPPGMEERRLKIYRELFFNNVDSLLGGNFPAIRKTLGPSAWATLIRDFYRDHDCRTPLFPELPREFMRYLDVRAESAESGEADGLPGWIHELAHYEWVELALQLSEAGEDDIAHRPDGDLSEGRPLLSPLAWPLAYAWPVHRIGPDYRPDTPPDTPTFLLLQRDRDGKVVFHALTALSFRLLQRLDESPHLDGRSQLQALAAEAGVEADSPAGAGLIADGARQLAALREAGIVLGTRHD
jgi:uncharacterized protein